ncbi:MAG: hypothetical protein ACAI34_14525 [Verrucomicrobium sp.]
MTIFILAVLTILVIGFLTTMQTERQAAGAYENTQRTKLVAQGAVSHAIDILRNNIPDPARLSEGPAQAPGENWVTNPGRLTIIRGGQTPVYVPLHTGEVITQPPSGPLREAESVNLNKPLPGSTTPAIVPAATTNGTPPEMRVKWVNILRDPAAPASPQNRLSARYAFWMDDETARINFNTAIGKPAPGADTRFTRQLTDGFMPPIFKRGGDDSTSGDGERTWGLGKPQSVNLDVLFANPANLLQDKLLAQTFLNGFARFPEAIMDYANVSDPKAWYEANKFNLTFYNRSPEFNAFGRSRLFTSYIPLSLEAGPSYQLPFIYDPQSANGEITPRSPEGELEKGTLLSGQLKDNQILSLNSLMGFFGAGVDIPGPGGYTADKANMVNRNQIRMLMEYFQRRWPGYEQSFVDKYGYIGSFQIALNILQQARMATTQMSEDDLGKFSAEYAARSTSVNFYPNSTELAGAAPERFYWRIKDPATDKVELMLPQMPGPHITELRLFVQATTVDPPPKGTPPLTQDSRYIKYWYEVEYYMQPFGPVVDLKEFPTRMDYFEITAKGGGKNPSQQFGASSAEDPRNDRQWHNKFMNLLATFPEAGTLIGPKGSKWDGNNVPNRVVVKSPEFAIGKFQRVDDDNPPTNKSDAPARKDDKVAGLTPVLSAGQITNIWDPVVFDSSVNAGTAKINIRWRPGQGTLGNENRPRQMIPLGLTPDDTLKVDLTVDLKEVGVPKVVSWQIADPNLSHDATQWVMTGPGKENKIGTPGKINAGEPAEDSSEKSKFRSIQRTPAGAKLSGYNYNRPDEYVTSSRVSSPGYWSLLHTGMQSRIPWKTLDFGPSNPNQQPPDWLLLDLFGATYPMAHDQWKIDKKLPDSFSTASYMGSTAGQVNLNSRIYPRNAHFNIPDRHLPLEAVFKHLRSDSQVKGLVDNITTYQTDNRVFDYVGKLAEVSGYDGGATTTWEKESLLRNMAGVLTTRSNTFGLWGAAQVLQKSSRNNSNDTFEAGDRVLGEKRFYALIERYIWTGRDGVPGNGHLSNVGVWDRAAQQTNRLSTADGITDTLFQLPGSPPLKRSGDGARLEIDAAGRYPKFDGPEPVGMDVYTASALGSVEYSSSSLEDAYNPPQAAIKYRVVYFKYLDE